PRSLCRQHHPEADAIASRGRGPVALGRSAIASAVVPGTAADDEAVPLVRPGRVLAGAVQVIVAAETIAAPVPAVSVHVEQAEGVGRIAAARRRPAAMLAGRGATEKSVVVVGLPRSQAPAEGERPVRRAPGPTGVLPLGLRRQAIASAEAPFLGQQ